MADVWANSMACHPRATCHVAGCSHLANSMSWFQSYVSYCRVLPPSEFNGMSSQSHVSHCRVLPLGEFTVTIPAPHATHIAGCSHLAKSMSWSWHIAGCKNSIRHIENRFHHMLFFLFLVQFRLWRAAAVVSSPIHTLTMKNTTLLLFSYKSSIQLDIGNKQVFSFTVSTTDLHRNLCRLNTATYHKMLNAL